MTSPELPVCVGKTILPKTYTYIYTDTIERRVFVQNFDRAINFDRLIQRIRISQSDSSEFGSSELQNVKTAQKFQGKGNQRL